MYGRHQRKVGSSMQVVQVSEFTVDFADCVLKTSSIKVLISLRTLYLHVRITSQVSLTLSNASACRYVPMQVRPTQLRLHISVNMYLDKAFSAQSRLV